MKKKNCLYKLRKGLLSNSMKRTTSRVNLRTYTLNMKTYSSNKRWLKLRLLFKKIKSKYIIRKIFNVFTCFKINYVKSRRMSLYWQLTLMQWEKSRRTWLEDEISWKITSKISLKKSRNVIIMVTGRHVVTVSVRFRLRYSKRSFSPMNNRFKILPCKWKSNDWILRWLKRNTWSAVWLSK